MPADNDNPLLSLQAFAAEELVRSTTPPPGWAPGLVWDGSRGTLTTGTLDSPPTDWGPLLAARGLDPDVYEIVGDTIWGATAAMLRNLLAIVTGTFDAADRQPPSEFRRA